MKNKYKYLVAGIAIILFVLPSVLGGQLPAPNEPRDCYKWGQTGGLYMCFEPITGTYAMWFSSYDLMHAYYTPQLRETAWTVGNTQVIEKRIIQDKYFHWSNDSLEKIQTMTLTGSPSYTYTKHV